MGHTPRPWEYVADKGWGYSVLSNGYSLGQGGEGVKVCYCCGLYHHEDGRYCVECHGCEGTCDWKGSMTGQEVEESWKK